MMTNKARKVFFGITSSSRQQDFERRKSVRSTWVSDLSPRTDYMFIRGKDAKGRDDAWYVNCEDSNPDHLSLKTRELCRRFLEDTDADYLWKIDDDSYVRLNRFKIMIDDIPFGTDFAGSSKNSKYFCSGGPGYFLSRKAAEFIASDTNPVPTYNEDVRTFEILQENNIHSYSLQRHLRPWRTSSNALWSFDDPAIVIVHYARPFEMVQEYRKEKADRKLCRL